MIINKELFKTFVYVNFFKNFNKYVIWKNDKKGYVLKVDLLIRRYSWTFKEILLDFYLLYLPLKMSLTI